MDGAEERHFYRVGVFVIVERDGRTLLLKRKNTGYRDGWYAPIGGHVNRGEAIKTAAVREAREEAGIRILKKDVKPVHVMHKMEHGNGSVLFVMKADKWTGKPSNREKDRCSAIGWFGMDRLPVRTIPYIRACFKNMKEHVFYSEYGWH